jgi:hypothetical protein
MNPENLLQFIPFLKDLFINKDNQVEKENPELTKLRKRVKKHFKKPGSGEADWARYNLANQLLFESHSGQESVKKYGMQGWKDGKWKRFDAIDFIEAGKKGGKGTFLGKKMIYPQISELLANENFTDEQLKAAFKGYKSLIENPEAAKEAPSFRVPQELLAAYGKEYAPVMKEFFEKEYPKGDYTSAEDVLSRIALGDKPGGVTLDLTAGVGARYHGLGGSYKKPDFASAFPTSGKYAVYQTGSDAVDRNIALQNTERNLLGHLITSSVSGETSRNKFSVPTSPARIDLGTMPHMYGRAKFTEQGIVPGSMVQMLQDKIAHEFGHSSPLFTEREYVQSKGKLGTAEGMGAHWPSFAKLLGGSWDTETRTRTPGALDLRGEGGLEATKNILKAYLESQEYKAQMAHPTIQFQNLMRGIR